MMDHIEEWFYSQLGGIQMQDGSDGIGFHHFTISPWIPEDMNQLQVSTKSQYGEILSAYTRQEGSLRFHFLIPSNTIATIILPVSHGIRLFEDDNEVTAATEGIHSIQYSDSTVSIEVGSGDYNFTMAENTTGIEGYKWDANKEGSLYYTLSGLVSKSPRQRGIFIHNGEKIIIK